MTKIVQEKFQVNMPPERNDDAHGGWIPDKAARVKKMQPGREGRPGGDDASRFGANNAFFNTLPPGMDIEDQEVCDIRRMGLSISGNNPIAPATGDQTDNELTAQSIRTGFTRKKLLSTDDEYTREHNDAFYDSVEVDGVEGFIERNNMLDRL
jgi:hypothetical protein